MASFLNIYAQMLSLRLSRSVASLHTFDDKEQKSVTGKAMLYTAHTLTLTESAYFIKTTTTSQSFSWNKEATCFEADTRFISEKNEIINIFITSILCKIIRKKFEYQAQDAKSCTILLIHARIQAK